MFVRMTRGIGWTALACALLVQPGVAQNADRIDQVVKHFADETRRFMGSVIVAKDGAVVFNRAYGYANLEWQVPNTADTRFRIGSVSKQFTAASILLLEERGKLRTDDLVKKHLPDAPPAWDAITIHHVLTHTSGIPNITSFPEFQRIKTLPSRPDQSLARFRDKPLDFPPGEKFSYSNSGYLLLAVLVERASGQTFEAFLQENILGPLGMTHTGSDSFTTIIPNRASGYTPTLGARGGPLRNAEYIDMTIPIGGGSLYSTTADLARWAHALFNGTVLSAASLQKMTRPVLSDYGYAIVVRSARGRQTFEHTGGIEGFNSILRYFPESKIAVAVLANVNGNLPTTIADRVARLAHGETVTLPTEMKEVTLAAAVLSRYVGVYEIKPGQSLVIALDSGRLYASGPHGVRSPMYAESETKFLADDGGLRLEFTVGADGQASSVDYDGIKASRKPG
jgi:CubicO group peptidase (beta-lactamase class C family)